MGVFGITFYSVFNLILWDSEERFIDGNITFHVYDVHWDFIGVVIGRRLNMVME